MGAWIETGFVADLDLGKTVAPYVGAWIETYDKEGCGTVAMSHPTWVRGLKLARLPQP